MSTSILTDVKKVLNLAEEYTAFDTDILMHINTVFATLNSLGIGPEDGFEIEDKTTTWDAFVADIRMNSIRTFMFLKVRLYFDPPQTAHHISAMERQVDELAFRLSILRESDSWTPPVSV